MSIDSSQTDPGPAPEAGAGAAKGWDVYSVSLSEDPHARWRTIRERTPVLDLGEGVYFVSSWRRVDEILRDARHTAGSGVAASFGGASDDALDDASEDVPDHTSDHTSDRASDDQQNGTKDADPHALAFEAMRVWLMSLDGREQTRARGLVRREFTPRRIEGLRPRIVETVDRLVSAIESRAECEAVDLVDALGFALPSEIIRSLFGLSEPDWRREIESVIRSVDDSPGASLDMIEGLAQAFRRRVERGEVPDGLLAQLRKPDPELGALSPLEVVANAVLLVTAAIDTTAGLIGNLAHCLLDRPALVDRIRRDPASTAAIVEETLRFEPPALSCSRRAGVDLVLDGVSIPAGSHLLLGLAAANRDPSRYASPDVFDPDRDFQGLLSFGGGRHFCLGAALARLEAQVVADRLFASSRLDFERIEPPTWQRKNPTVRALERLPIRARLRRP